MGALAGLSVVSGAVAQTWPSKPIRLFVGNPPGGTNDILARLIQNSVSEILGQQIVIENKPGAGTVVATEATVRSAPDGHTIGTIISVHASNPSLQPKLPYDPIKDVTPIAFLGHVANLVVVHPSVPANTLPELIALAKAKPGTIHHGTSGNGTSQHFSGELLKLGAGIDIVHVPYRGGGPAINDVVGGQIQMMFGNFASILPHVQSGRVRSLAITSPQRSPVFPNLPTVAEAAGIPGYAVTEWYAVIGPAGMNPEHVKKINEAIYTTLKKPEIASKLRDQGIEVDYKTPEDFGKFLVAEIAKFKDIVERAKIKIAD
ncbi:Bug family tripartite tricarboxylate transporter substrate binding protein [uncultured Enterovirga sp.]|uniref:Bug family tripartite tricarboxylate transporter substrate binding protein n=1 Tax=uncultured Enterovirga sp. TaxID=2026352 RepID=UPI0035CC54BE